MITLMRHMLIGLLCLGLILPKATAVLAAVLPTDVQTITICTGTGIQTIRLDGEGNPIEEQDLTEAPCLASHATLSMAAHLPGFQQIIRRFDQALDLNRPSPHSITPYDPSRAVRAPPAL